MLGPRRHELHREVGEAMETLFADRASELRGIIAEHFLRGEEWAKAVELLGAAGDAAASLYAHAEARQHYTEEFDRFSASLKTVAMRNNGKYAGLPTSLPLEEAIFGNLARIRSIA